MRQPHAVLRVIAAVALAGSACARALPPTAPSTIPTTFAVRIDRARRVGYRGKVSIALRTTRTRITEQGGEIVTREEESQDIELEATEKVLQVDATGDAVEVELAVEKLSVQNAAGRTELIPRGRIVTVERGAFKVGFRSADTLSPAAEKALAELVPTRSSGPTDDEVFGIAAPQAIGASWPVNATLAARDLGAHLPVTAQPPVIRGQSQLVGLAQVAGQTCLEVTGEIDVGPTAGPSETTEIRSTFRMLLPVDTALPSLDTSSTLDVGVGTLPASPSVGIRTTTIQHREKRERRTPLR